MPFEHQPFASLAVALLRVERPGTDLHAYLAAIDATLAPFGGRFVVHGGDPRPVEGDVDHDLIVLGFPTRDGAGRWYASPAYQALVPLRRSFATGSVVLYAGADDGHHATDVLGAGA